MIGFIEIIQYNISEYDNENNENAFSQMKITRRTQ